MKETHKTWHGMYVTTMGTPQPDPDFTNNTEEMDTRIWRQTSSIKGIVVSPDTDVYFIGLPLYHGDTKDIIVSPYNQRQVQCLHLTHLVTVLATVPQHIIPHAFQALYVVTGCDYISFFSGIGKATFMMFFTNMQASLQVGQSNTLAL